MPSSAVFMVVRMSLFTWSWLVSFCILFSSTILAEAWSTVICTRSRCVSVSPSFAASCSTTSFFFFSCFFASRSFSRSSTIASTDFLKATFWSSDIDSNATTSGSGRPPSPGGVAIVNAVAAEPSAVVAGAGCAPSAVLRASSSFLRRSTSPERSPAAGVADGRTVTAGAAGTVLAVGRDALRPTFCLSSSRSNVRSWMRSAE